jgi:nitrate reductase NapD
LAGPSCRQLLAEACTGCGACISVCPVGAVTIRAEHGGRRCLKRRRHHISSAVIACQARLVSTMCCAALAGFDNVEVHGADKGKIVVVIEGPSTGVLGDTLMRISLLDGVIAANMVFEHVEMEEERG